MITSAPINLKDIADIRFIKESQGPNISILKTRLKRSELLKRMTDQNLINHAARIKGYDKQSELMYATIIDSTLDGQPARSVVFHTKPVPNSYVVLNGKVVSQ